MELQRKRFIKIVKSKLSFSWISFTMAAPVFSKHWYDKPERDQKAAMSKFQAAVASARSGTDEAVKQVLERSGCNSE